MDSNVIKNKIEKIPVQNRLAATSKTKCKADSLNSEKGNEMEYTNITNRSASAPPVANSIYGVCEVLLTEPIGKIKLLYYSFRLPLVLILKTRSPIGSVKEV